MIRSIALVSAGTLTSRLLGFVRDAMIAALLGAGIAADAFLLTFQLITLIRRLFSEGALNAALIPAWWRVRDREGFAQAAAFTGRAVGTLGLIVALIAVLAGLTAPFFIAWLAPALAKRGSFADGIIELRLMLPYLAFAGPAAVMLAIGNAQRNVALSAIAPALFNLVLIAVTSFLLTGDRSPRDAAMILAASVGIAGLLQLAVLLGSERAAARPLRISFDPEMRTLLRRSVPSMISGAGPQLLLLIGALVATRQPSAVACLYFAGRLIDLPLGLVGTAAGTVMIAESSHATRGGHDAQMNTLRAQGIGTSLALTLPATCGLALLAEPIVRAVFARGEFGDADVAATAGALQMLALALPAQGLAKMMAVDLFTHDDGRTPVIGTLIGAAVTLAIAFALSRDGDLSRIGIAVAFGSWATVGVLAIKAQLPLLNARAGAILAATLTMAAIVTLLRAIVAPAGPNALWLALMIAGGAITYALALLAYRAVRPGEIAATWRGLRGDDPRGKGTATAKTQDESK